jgi:RHS repeat-associated protein
MRPARSRAGPQSNDGYAWTGAYIGNRDYTTNGLNQYTTTGPPSEPPAATFTYDANGNLTSDGSAMFTYDVENRLVAAGGSRTAALRYDPLGRLYEVVGAATTRFLYDGDALIGEYNLAGTMTDRYVHGSNAGADDPLVWYGNGTIYWLHSDHQGSITAIANIDGNLLWLNAYDEYGIPRAGNQGRFQYTGQAWIGELGMYHYKARVYSPTLGRFLQTDPIGYTGGINLYGYVGDDPVNHTDTGGLTPGDPYRTPQDASVDFQNAYNGRSIRENVEYNAATYELNGRFYSSRGYRTDFDGGTSVIGIPTGARHVEDSHTHGDYSRVDIHDARIRTSRLRDGFQSDKVNRADRDRANTNRRVVTIGTPSGKYLRYDPATRHVETINPYVPTVVPPEQPQLRETPRPDPPPQ